MKFVTKPTTKLQNVDFFLSRISFYERKVRKGERERETERERL